MVQGQGLVEPVKLLVTVRCSLALRFSLRGEYGLVQRLRTSPTPVLFLFQSPESRPKVTSKVVAAAAYAFSCSHPRTLLVLIDEYVESL